MHTRRRSALLLLVVLAACRAGADSLAARSPGKYGDVVVLRTSGSNGYSRYLVRLDDSSVTSIVITSVAGANSSVAPYTLGVSNGAVSSSTGSIH